MSATLDPPDLAMIEAAYIARTAGSAAVGQRAQRVMPGGDTRAVGHHPPYPLTVARGDGPYMWDVDGNRYVDLIGNHTSLVHGYAYPPITEAVTRQLSRGTVWPARSEAQIALAELLVERVASVDLVRFTNSGAEAANLAMRTARMATGRDVMLMAAYGYHGQMHDLETGAYGSGHERLLLAPYGDLASFERILAERGDQIAAVFLEPVQGAGGVIDPPPGFLAGVRAATHRAGALLVLDEVITFRLSEGGGQARAGVEADLTMFGKIIGGGFPCGAVGGRREVMEVLDPRTSEFRHSGTFNGNLITTTAGAIAVEHLTADRIVLLEELASRLRRAVEESAAHHGVPCSTTQAGSLVNVFFTDEVPVASVLRSDLQAIAAFHVACLTRGVFMATRGMIATSTALDDRAMDLAVEGLQAAVGDIAGMCS